MGKWNSTSNVRGLNRCTPVEAERTVRVGVSIAETLNTPRDQ